MAMNLLLYCIGHEMDRQTVPFQIHIVKVLDENRCPNIENTEDFICVPV